MIQVSGLACSYGKRFILPAYDPDKFQRDLGKRASSFSHSNGMKILIGKQLRGVMIGRRDVPLRGSYEQGLIKILSNTGRVRPPGSSQQEKLDQ